MSLWPKVVIFYVADNFLLSPKIMFGGGGEGEDNTKIWNANPYWCILLLQGIDKQIRTAQIRSIQLNPIRNGGQLNFTSVMYVTLIGYHLG